MKSLHTSYVIVFVAFVVIMSFVSSPQRNNYDQRTKVSDFEPFVLQTPVNINMDVFNSFLNNMPNAISSVDQSLLRSQIRKSIAERKIDNLLLMKISLIKSLTKKNTTKQLSPKGPATLTGVLHVMSVPDSSLYHSIIIADSSKQLQDIMHTVFSKTMDMNISKKLKNK